MAEVAFLPEHDDKVNNPSWTRNGRPEAQISGQMLGGSDFLCDEGLSKMLRIKG